MKHFQTWLCCLLLFLDESWQVLREFTPPWATRDLGFLLADSKVREEQRKRTWLGIGARQTWLDQLLINFLRKALKKKSSGWKKRGGSCRFDSCLDFLPAWITITHSTKDMFLLRGAKNVHLKSDSPCYTSCNVSSSRNRTHVIRLTHVARSWCWNCHPLIELHT